MIHLKCGLKIVIWIGRNIIPIKEELEYIGYVISYE